MTTSSPERLIPVSPYAVISHLEPVSDRPYAGVPGTRVLLSTSSLREATREARRANGAMQCGAALVGHQSLPCPIAVFYMLAARTMVLLAFNPTDPSTRELMQLNRQRQALALAFMDVPTQTRCWSSVQRATEFSTCRWRTPSTPRRLTSRRSWPLLPSL